MSLKVAAIQLCADENKARNVQKAARFVQTAADKGARFVLLPEVFNFRGKITSLNDLERVTEAVPGPSIDPFLSLARRNRIYISTGSILERAPKRKAYNTSTLIAPSGNIQAIYRKRNLF